MVYIVLVRRSEAEILLKRAKAFLKNAEYLIGIKEYDLAAFNLEHSLQLLLKYKLLVEAGEYPRTHSLRKLFRIIIDLTGDEEIKRFYMENIDTIGNLEASYITARYLPVEFEEFEVRNMLELVKKAFKLLIGDSG